MCADIVVSYRIYCHGCTQLDMVETITPRPARLALI